MDIHTLKECISKADDPRRTSHGHVLHRFEDIIIIDLCTVVSDGEDFADMEMFGREREAWLRRFLELPNGIPDADMFRRVFEAVDPAELGACLRKWLEVERAGRGVVSSTRLRTCASFS